MKLAMSVDELRRLRRNGSTLLILAELNDCSVRYIETCLEQGEEPKNYVMDALEIDRTKDWRARENIGERRWHVRNLWIRDFSQTEIHRILNVSPSTINYDVKVLMRNKKIRPRKTTKEKAFLIWSRDKNIKGKDLAEKLNITANRANTLLREMSEEWES